MKAKVNAVFEPFFAGLGLGIDDAQVDDKVLKRMLLSATRRGKFFRDEVSVKFVVNHNRALDFSRFEIISVLFVTEHDIA